MSLPDLDKVDQLARRVDDLEYQVGTYHTSCTGLALLVVIMMVMLLWALWRFYAHG